ncbi:Vomeromodulin [Plecturocebus cupreus]
MVTRGNRICKGPEAPFLHLNEDSDDAAGEKMGEEEEEEGRKTGHPRLNLAYCDLLTQRPLRVGSGIITGHGDRSQALASLEKDFPSKSRQTLVYKIGMQLCHQQSGGKAASEHLDPSTPGKVRTCCVEQAKEKFQLTDYPSLFHLDYPSLFQLDYPFVFHLDRSLEVYKSQKFLYPENTQRGPKAACVYPSPSTSYLTANSKTVNMNATLPTQIEKMLKCEKVDLAGLLGTVLSTVSNLDLLSILDLTSSLDILGGGSLGGLLGEGNGGKSSNLPLLSEVTGAVSGLLPQGTEGLGSLLSTGSDKNLVKGLLDGTGLSALQQPLNDVTDKVGDLKESAQGVLNSALPSGIVSGLSDLLKNADLEQLLLGLQVEKVTVESMKSTMTGDGIHVQATTTVFIGGNGRPLGHPAPELQAPVSKGQVETTERTAAWATVGKAGTAHSRPSAPAQTGEAREWAPKPHPPIILLGAVVSLLGFNVHGDVALMIGLSTNDTRCVKLQVQEKAFEAKKVTLQLIQTYGHGYFAFVSPFTLG